MTYPAWMIGGADPRAERRRVYIVEAEGLGLVKIGVANSVKQRLASLSKMCPVPLRLVAVADTDKIGTLEKELHARFAEHRSHGEWFHFAPEIVSYTEQMLLS